MERRRERIDIAERVRPCHTHEGEDLAWPPAAP